MEISSFDQWLDTFLKEKHLTNKQFQIKHSGAIHFIDSVKVIELIRQSSAKDQTDIKSVIVKIDFQNGDVNHFFEHLAKGYIECHY